MKKILFKLFVFISLLIVFTGCATTEHMTAVEGKTELKPDAGKAMVVFMRPSSFGGAILATVYDGEEYIGTVPANSKFAYQTEPGEHMFMVIGESADFMKAELAANKTYYARVAARMGLWKARFSFIPYNKEEPASELEAWINDTKLMTPNEKGTSWAAENAVSIKEKHDEYLPQWQQKDPNAQAKQTLFAESGQ